MNKTIIHIGYPKTGTTWFQKNFYPKIEGSCFLNRKIMCEHIIFKDVFDFNPIIIKEKLDKISNDQRVLICEELLLGGLDIGYGSGEFIVQNAKRLKELFGNSTVVIFIRNQQSILESSYSQYIKSGGTYSVKKYIGLKGRFNRQFQNYHLFNPRLYNYYNIIKMYSDFFGKENVHVFFYEDFERNPVQFIDDFCIHFCLKRNEKININQKENARLSSFLVSFLRFLNLFTRRNTPFKNYIIDLPRFYSLLIFITYYLSKSKIMNRFPFRFNKFTKVWINNYYKSSNGLLQKFVDPQKLKDYGYPL